MATFAISSFIEEAKQVLLYITKGQIILAISVYAIVVKMFMKNHNVVSSPKTQTSSTIHDLALSPIPPNYMTTSAVNKMLQLVESGMCISLEECMAQFDKETDKQKHKQELEMIGNLQIISYH